MLTIYKASAGSGKTYRLTRDYITMLLGVPEQQDTDAGTPAPIRLNHRDIRGFEERNRHRGILAITFTNKATQEMKDRIVGELDRLRNITPDLWERRNDPALTKEQKKALSYAPYLIEGGEDFSGFGCTVQQLSETAGRALRQLLLDYGHFNVSTIDSFFQTVLRNLAYELDQPGDYEVTLDDNAVVTESVRMMIDDFNCGRVTGESSAELHTLFRNIMTDNRDRGKDVNLFNTRRGLFKEIVGYARNIFDEQFHEFSGSMDAFIKDTDRIRAFDKTVRTMLADARVALCDEARAVLDWATRLAEEVTPNKDGKTLTPKIYSLLEACGAYRAGDDKRRLPLPDLNKLGDQVLLKSAVKIAEAGTDKASAQDIKSFLNAILYADCLKCMDTDSLLDDALPRIIRLCKKAVKASDLDLIVDNLPVYRIMGLIGAYIAAFREDNNVVILADTAEMLKSVMSDNGDVPFVYEKIGVRLKHFLIDEFQDTSKLQWRCLEPLITESLGYRNNSLIIGDEKQAIYRFRNSDSSLLHHDVPAHYGADAHVVTGDNPADNTNYRSCGDIVRFNNTLFRGLVTKAYPAVADEYSNVEQSVAPDLAGVPGYIKFVNMGKRPGADKKKKKSDPAPAEVAPAETRTDYQVMLAEIMRQHDAGYKYSKIAVLTDTNNQAGEAAQTLLAANIPVATEEALKLCKSPVINLIVSIMDAVSRVSSPTYTQPSRTEGTPYYRRHDLPVPDLVNTVETIYNRLVSPQSGQTVDGTRCEKPEMPSGPDCEKPETDSEAGISPQTRALEQALTILSDPGHTPASAPVELYRENPSTLVTLVEFIIDRYLTDEQRRTGAAFIAAFQDEVLQYTQTFSESLPAFLRWWQTSGQKISLSTPDSIDAVRVMTIHKSKGLEFECVHIPNASWSVGTVNAKDAEWVAAPQSLREAGFPEALFVRLPKRCALPDSIFRKDYLDEVRAVTLDDLNKTYVAYTRARTELCVYYTHGTGIGESLGPVMAGSTDGGNPDVYMDLSQHYSVATGDFEFGSPTSPAADAADDKADNKADNKTAVSNKGKKIDDEDIRIYTGVDGYRINTRIGRVITTIDSGLTLSTNTGDADTAEVATDMTDDGKRQARQALLEQAADRGTRIHAVMSRIHTTATVDRVLRGALKFGTLSTDDARMIRDFFDDVTLKPLLADWFDNVRTARNEVSYGYTDAERDEWMGRRIDRLVFRTDGGIDILDYKTTAPFDRLPEGEQRDQTAQLQEYMRHISGMYPGRRVRAYLLYLPTRQVHRV